MTTAADALVLIFNSLSPDEQDESFERIAEVRLRRIAGTESDSEQFLRSLRRVAEYVGHPASVDEYKQASLELIAAGENIETFARVYAHYGAWPRAKEALSLSETTTARRIEARFRYRRVGKVWRFTDDVLRDALIACAEHHDRPPSVPEFERWRDRQFELARAEGNHTLQLPSASPYRRRWDTWEGALLHFGFTLAEAAQRYQQPFDPKRPETEPFVPDAVPVAELRNDDTGAWPLLAEEAVQRVRSAYERLSRRSRYVLTVRLGLGGVEPLSLKAVAAPVSLHFERIRQLQIQAVDMLAQAAAGDDPVADESALRDATVATLRHLAG